MFDTKTTRASLTLSFLVALASPSKADILTVDDSGGAGFTDIQSAVNAASDGDTILVYEGSYAGFLVEDKALNVFAETNNVVNVTSTVQISNLVEPKRLVLSGLRITAPSIYPQSPMALAMNVNTGSVRIQSCTLKGGAGKEDIFAHDDEEPFGSGGIGADLFFCTDVAFVGCTIDGGTGSGITTGYSEGEGGLGGKGVFARISAVALYDCTVRGGSGGPTCGPGHGGQGAEAYHAPTGGFFASGSSFQGGAGGSTFDFLFTYAGDGGDAIAIGTNANIHLLDETTVGGAAGNALFGADGQPGVGISGSGINEQLSGTRRKCTAASIAAPASQLAVTITGQPGDEVFLPSSRHSYFRYRAGMHGTWLIRVPAKMTAQPVGVIPPSGILQTQIPIAALPPGSGAIITIVQALVVDTLGNSFIASPVHVLHQ